MYLILSFFNMLFLFWIFYYFFVVRFINTLNKKDRNLMRLIVPGDEVLTADGIIGVVTKVNDAFVRLQISDNSIILVNKMFIAIKIKSNFETDIKIKNTCETN